MYTFSLSKFSALDHNVACDAADDKCDTGLGLACDNVTLTCACSNTNATYKTSVGTCTTKSLFGESCATSADCFTDIGSSLYFMFFHHDKVVL